jgi:hypothetical protein
MAKPKFRARTKTKAAKETKPVKAGKQPKPPAEEVEAMDFFPNQKLKIQLRSWAPRQSPAKEFRLHLELSIPLTADVKRMPHQIAAAFETVATLDNGVPDSSVETPIEPQTIRIFATPDSRSAAATWPASVLNRLEVVRPKMQSKKDQSEVELRFSTTVKVSNEQLIWCKDHTRKFCWATFEQTQEKLIKKAKQEAAEEAVSEQLELSPEDYAGSPQQSAVLEMPVGKEAAANDK